MKLELVGLPDSDLKLICEMSLAAPRPLVPTHLRRQIIAELHKLAHPGVKASIALVQERFFWPNLPTDIRKFVETCVPCQRAKIHRHTRPAVQFIPMPADCFDHVHIDVVGPLPPSGGCPYLLTMVDR